MVFILLFPNRTTALIFFVTAASELSAALLSRARSIAKEHEKLRDLLGENFDTKVAKRMGELAPVAQAVKDWDKTQEVGYKDEHEPKTR